MINFSLANYFLIIKCLSRQHYLCKLYIFLQSDSELDNSAELNAEVFSSLPRNFRLNRSRLSDDFAETRSKRRESFGFPSARLDETSNLIRMRANPSLGSSEPNLSGSCVSWSQLKYIFCNLIFPSSFFLLNNNTKGFGKGFFMWWE